MTEENKKKLPKLRRVKDYEYIWYDNIWDRKEKEYVTLYKMKPVERLEYLDEETNTYKPVEVHYADYFAQYSL